MERWKESKRILEHPLGRLSYLPIATSHCSPEKQPFPTSSNLIRLKHKGILLEMFLLAWVGGSFVWNFSCISWELSLPMYICLSIYREYGEKEGKTPPNALHYLFSSYCLCTPVGSWSAFTDSILLKSKPESITDISSSPRGGSCLVLNFPVREGRWLRP